MRIQHNIMAMSAYRNYTNNVSAMKKNLEKLSSGYKINRAGDDAAGLAISEKMRAQITGLETAQKNAKDGISLVQTAEGALTEVHDMLNRMVELATQSANGTYDSTQDRKQLQKEVDQLLDEIDRIADSSNFNGIKLLDGSLGLNGEAVQNVEYVGAAAAGADTPITGASVASIHGDDPKTYQQAKFSIDLADVNVTTTAAGAKVTVTVSGVGTLTATMGAAGVKTATTIASKLAASVKFANGSNASKGFAIGNAYYKVSASGTKLTFEYIGIEDPDNAGKIKQDTTGDLFTSTMAASFTSKVHPGAKVTIGATSANTVIDTDNKIIHGITSYQAGVSAQGVDRLGADINVQNALMTDGAVLKIDDKEFKISLSSTATKSVRNGTDITISTKNAASAPAQLKELIQVMAGATTANFTISAKNGKLHMDAKSTSNVKKADLSSKVSTYKEGTPAHNKGVEFDVKASKFTKGDVVKVGDMSFVYQGTAAESTKVKNFTSVDELKTKLGAAFGNANVVTATNGSMVKFSVYASTATKAAPMLQGRGLTLQIGDTSEKFNQLNVGVQDMHAVNLGIKGLKIDTEVDAQNAIQKIKDAINTVSDVRGTLGATQNRLDHTINNLSVMTENIQDAESTIRDVDVAEEMMAYTKNNILIQSAQAMLAQANQVPQGVLQLLQ